MNSRFYVGEIVHSRLEPIRHTFRYPVTICGFDLDELPQLDRDRWWFGYNRLRPVSVHDRDYLVAAQGDSIRDRLLAILRENSLDDRVKRVCLVTAARFFNYAFNPVSFYYCLDENDRAVCHLAEVNNTFHERSIYLLNQPCNPSHGYEHRYVVQKDFYVSPFNDTSGEFDFQFAQLGDTLDIRADVRRDGRLVYHAVIRGRGEPLSTMSFARMLARFPISTATTMPRILWQAAKLHYQRGLPVVPQPKPTRDTVVRTDKPSLVDRLVQSAVLRAFSNIRRGQLRLRMPNGECLTFGTPGTGLQGEIHLRSWKFFRRLAMASDIGFGESYQAREWDSPDLTAALSVMADNMDVVAWQSRLGRLIIPLQAIARRLFRLNSRTGSRRNISAHYDLGNDMYEMFLDPTMMYSSAIFEHEEEDLETAQRRKLAEIIRKGRIDQSHHVLEIGTGWGGFAIEAVRQTGCRVTTVTLSKEQKKLAEERIRRAGLSERIQVKLCDYREIRGQYDRIVSIEMLEAVGHEFHGAYFAALDRLLKPNGLAVIQVITIPDHRYPAYLRAGDWIQKYIFPGCAVPSLAALSAAMAKSSRLFVEELVNIGPHYATTLRIWRERFLAQRERLVALGYDDDFIRTWDFYFSYCEAGFARRVLNNLHLVLTASGNEALDTRTQTVEPHPTNIAREVALI